MKKVIALALCLLMVFGMTSCSITTPEYVITVDGEKIPCGLYLLYQLQAYTAAKQFQYDAGKKVWNDTVLGQNGADYVHEQTLKSCRNYVWVEREFDRQGLVFSKAELAELETSAATAYKGNTYRLDVNGVSLETYTKYYINARKYARLYEAFQKTDAASFTNAEAVIYMNDTYAHIRLVNLPLNNVDSKKVSGADEKKLQGYANDMADALNNGGNFDTLADEALKNAFAVTGHEYTENAVAENTYDTWLKRDNVYFGDAEMSNTLLASPKGFSSVAQSASFVVAYQKIDGVTDGDEFEEKYKPTIIGEMQTKAFEEKIAADTAVYEVTEDASAVATYSIKKIKEV